jgi:hypothetical protein
MVVYGFRFFPFRAADPVLRNFSQLIHPSSNNILGKEIEHSLHRVGTTDTIRPRVLRPSCFIKRFALSLTCSITIERENAVERRILEGISSESS